MMYSFLENSIDIHIHCCPHINKRSTDIFEVIKGSAVNEDLFFPKTLDRSILSFDTCSNNG